MRRIPLKLGTAWGVSLAIHLTLVSVLAFVAVRAAMEPPVGPERYMEFDDAGAEATSLDNTMLPADASSSSSAPAIAESRPLPATPDTSIALAAPSAPLPPSEPAPSADASAESTSAAWLAPAPISTAPAASSDAPADRPRSTAALPPITPKGGDVTFAGLGSSNARSVVYVVDASGPMVSALREVIDELDRSVSRLSATQRFGVIAFRRLDNGKETESFMPVLVRATPQAKKELREWLLALSPSGKSNPLSGLRAALELRPDAVFLLSRGIERSGGGLWERGLDATMDELDLLNPVNERSGRRDVVIKTIQFLDEDPTGTMQRIGQLHGLSKTAAGIAQPGYRVIKRGSELKDDPLDTDQ